MNFKRIRPSDLPDKIKNQISDIMFHGLKAAYFDGLVHKTEHQSIKKMVESSLIERGESQLWLSPDFKALHAVYFSDSGIRVAIIKEKSQ